MHNFMLLVTAMHACFNMTLFMLIVLLEYNIFNLRGIIKNIYIGEDANPLIYHSIA